MARLSTLLGFLLGTLLLQPAHAQQAGVAVPVLQNAIEPLIFRWTPAARGPGPRLGHSMVYDEARRSVVMFDGAWPRDAESTGTLWAWSGDRWIAMADRAPPATSFGAATFDSKRRCIIAHGGEKRPEAAAHWENCSPREVEETEPTPGSRYHHAIAFDASRGVTVLFGGMAGSNWDSATWEWDGTTWKRIEAPGPGARAAFRMVYDERRKHVVLFGGAAPPGQSGQSFFGDTWSWDGSSWTKMSADGPAPRRDYSMTFDSYEGVVLLYGGASATARYSDMWKWDGSRWSRLDLEGPAPQHRYVSAMAFDAARKRTVLYGGYSCAENGTGCGVRDDTWEWDGTRWQQVTGR